MSVRAKFVVANKQENRVDFQPVCTGSKENEEFWKYTPGGSIYMHIDNESALEQFEVGKEYYVDFTEAN